MNLVAKSNGKIIFSSDENGIQPALNLVKQFSDLSEIEIFDKIVGKAAAVVFVKFGARKIFAGKLSVAAKQFLTENNVQIEFDEEIEKILNRAQNDYCPMEKTVLLENNVEIAYEKLMDFLEKRKANNIN